MNAEWIETLLWNSSVGMMIIGIVTYIALVHFVTAPYGKFAQEKGWGPLIPAKLGWIIMETPNLWMTALIYLLCKNANVSLSIEGSLPNKVLLGLYLIHYVNRSLIFPNFLTHGNPMPISITFAAFIYCSWNGLNQSLSLVVVNKYDQEYLNQPQCLFGIALFFLGMYLNIKSDFILINLKKEIVEKNKKDGISTADLPPHKKYVIPHGGLYDYVTSANYCKFSELFSLFLLLIFYLLVHSRGSDRMDRVCHSLQ